MPSVVSPLARWRTRRDPIVAPPIHLDPNPSSAEGHDRLLYRPALDGLRAIAVVAVIIAHGMTLWLPGGWLGVDIFFVISGFLITSLLLTEQARRGHIVLTNFWLARARRLFPALAVVLLAVVVAASALSPQNRRAAISLDALATAFYTANWRMLFSNEGYFAAVAAPSPLRHTWSLSVEEQFYVLFPLLIIFLLKRVRRRTQLAGAFAGLALVSALVMVTLYEPGIDPARIYYGTDTRAFELLIGASAGALVFRGPSGLAAVGTWVDTWSRRLAIPAGVFVGLSLYAASFQAPLLFEGGLVLICLATAAVVVTCASATPNLLQGVLSWEPLRRIGIISYGLYLWHWPVMVFLNGARTGLAELPTFAAQVALTVGLAAASYRWVEQPIRRHGLRALVPTRPQTGRTIAIATMSALAVAVAALPHVDLRIGSGWSRDFSYTPPTYTPGPQPVTALLVGNSVPHGIADLFPSAVYPDLKVARSTSFGCDLVPYPKIYHERPEAITAECRDWRKKWVQEMRASEASVVAMFIPFSMISDREVDGRRLRWEDPDFAKTVTATLDPVAKAVATRPQTKLVVVNVACHYSRPIGPEDESRRTNNIADVRRLNAMVQTWADANGVAVIDQFGFLCTGGYHDAVNGKGLYVDGLHISADAGPTVWGWLAPQLRDYAYEAIGGR